MIPLRNILLRDLLISIALATASAALGLSLHALKGQPISLTYATKEERLLRSAEKIQRLNAVETPSSIREVTLDEVKRHVESKTALILDARPEVFHRLGHIPGALSLPREDFEGGYAKLAPIFDDYRNKPIVIYCSQSSCEDSELVHKGLATLGIVNLAIFRGGFSEWESADLEVESNL